MLLEQGQQALLNRAAVGVQLLVADGLPADMQRRSFGMLDQALLQALDQRDLRLLQQRRVCRVIETVDIRQFVEEQQVFQAFEIRRDQRRSMAEIIGIAGKAADQQRHLIDHMGKRSLA